MDEPTREEGFKNTITDMAAQIAKQFEENRKLLGRVEAAEHKNTELQGRLIAASVNKKALAKSVAHHLGLHYGLEVTASGHLKVRMENGVTLSELARLDKLLSPREIEVGISIDETVEIACLDVKDWPS